MVIFFFLASFLWVAFLSFRFRFLAPYFLLSLLTRVSLFVVHHFGTFVVPGGDADAASFENRASRLVELPWPELFSLMDPGTGSVNYSVIGAALIKLSGGQIIAMPAFNVLLGTIIATLTAVMVYRVWGRRAAIFVALILALYPFSLFNSVISLREDISTILGLLGACSVIFWVRGKGFLYLYLASVSFFLAACLHPGWTGALIGLAVYILIESKNVFIAGASRYRIPRSDFYLLVSAVVFVSGVVVLLSIPGFTVLALFDGYVGEDGDMGDAITARFGRDALGGSAYPGFIARGDPVTQPWLIPARVVYFLFSPFPWDIRSPRHVLGLASSVLYLFLFWKVCKHWDQIRVHRELIPVVFIVAGLTIVFAVGVTNIGTAIRHKTKFLPLLLLFGAVAFENLRFKSKR